MSHRALSGTDELGKRSFSDGAWLSPITHPHASWGRGRTRQKEPKEDDGDAPAP